MWYQTIAIVIVGTLCINRAEILSRTQDSFFSYLLHAMPFILLGQVCLYSIYNKAPSIMAAWLSWTITMSLLRVGSSHFILSEGLDLRWTLAGVAMMIGASLCLKQA